MKKLLLVTFLFASLFLRINAQSVAQPEYMISADNMKVLYAGIDNPVSILVSGAVDKNIKVAISGGTIITKGNGKYIVKADPGFKSLKITISAFKDGVMTKLGTEEFRVKSIPEPKAFIANKYNVTITKDEIFNNPIMTVQMENFDFFPELQFTVTEFSAATVTNGDLVEKHVVGNKISDSMMETIKQVKSGQKIYFENIKAKAPDGKIRNIESFYLEIK